MNEKLPGKKKASAQEVDAFVAKARALTKDAAGQIPGRLLFAIDATMSRQPSWDMACHIQAEMFRETMAIGGLSVQLAWFRGFSEFKVNPWVDDASALARQMQPVRCLSGRTQITRCLQHALETARETARKDRVKAMIYIGDCVEEPEAELYRLAGQLGLSGIRLFAFHEGHDGRAEKCFREMARLSGGAFAKFDLGSPDRLRALLAAVAVYAAGGQQALRDHGKQGRGAAQHLLTQIQGDSVC